jgi:hypothetical protein
MSGICIEWPFVDKSPYMAIHGGDFFLLANLHITTIIRTTLLYMASETDPLLSDNPNQTPQYTPPHELSACTEAGGPRPQVASFSHLASIVSLFVFNVTIACLHTL